jgi:TonB family protein
MPDNRQHAENPLAIGERRISARTPVSPQAFVKFGENNYGFVFNISETGLVFAPTGPLTLAVGAVAKMRFLLPDSQDWIQTSGEVAWIADSQKEAGVRFVDLGDDTRAKIKHWISQEPSRAQPPRPRIAPPESNESAKEPARVSASTGDLASKSGTFVDGAALNSILADPARLLRETKSAREKVAQQPANAPTNESLQVTAAMHVPERRSHIRRRVLSLEYIDLGSFNGGILLNLSEGGMYVQAVAGLSSDDLPQISFRLPDSSYVVKTNAQIAWTGESKKDAGIQFVNLPEEARLKIREWVAIEHPPVQSADESTTDAAPVRKKTERLLEMPPPGLSKKPGNIPEPPARPVQVQDSAPAPTLPVATGNPTAPKAVELLHLSGPILQTRLGDLPKISEEANPNISSPDVAVEPRSWRGLVAAIVIIVLLSFVAGWVVAGPGGRRQFFSMFDKQQENASTTAQDSSTTPVPAAVAENTAPAPTSNDASQQHVQQTPSTPVVTATTPDKSQPAKPSGNTQPAPSRNNSSNLSAAKPSAPPTQKPAAPVAHVNVPSGTLADANRTTRPSQPLTPSTASNSSAAPAQNKPQEIRPMQTAPAVTAPPVSNSAAKNSPSSGAPNASPQPPTTTVTAQTPNASPNPAATQPPTHVDTPSVVAKPPAPVEVVKGTVSVSASPFPSIHVPPEMKSQISKQGASLQLGQLISRVEPTYPEDAERQRIEGVVKLHVIIDRDGNIQNIDQMTGPPLLEAAAANAVRQWKYKPTSLGGQPVEAGVDVTVVFRLQVTHAN